MAVQESATQNRNYSYRFRWGVLKGFRMTQLAVFRSCLLIVTICVNLEPSLQRGPKEKQTVIVFWGVLFVCLFVSVMIDPGIHTKWVNETETLFQALLAIFHNYLCIQLISKNFPLYTIFYMYLFREIAIVMIKIYHVLCGTWWNLQYNINSKYIITGQKNGLFL